MPAPMAQLPRLKTDAHALTEFSMPDDTPIFARSRLYSRPCTTPADPPSGSRGTICKHVRCEERHRLDKPVFAFTGHLQHTCEPGNARNLAF
jgi:hypothetical protein